jgi:hypothetical protein
MPEPVTEMRPHDTRVEAIWSSTTAAAAIGLFAFADDDGRYISIGALVYTKHSRNEHVKTVAFISVETDSSRTTPHGSPHVLSQATTEVSPAFLRDGTRINPS